MSKNVSLLALSSVISLLLMILVDSLLGHAAKFLNAWNVIERFLGRPPEAGESIVARDYGPVGELLAVTHHILKTP